MSALTITPNDLPALRDQLDTIAEHDLAPSFDESAALRDAFATAATAIRSARASVMTAIDALRAAGVEMDGDDDE